MRTRQKHTFFCFGFLFTLFLTGCIGVVEEITPPPTITLAPTLTSLPTSTPVPARTSEPPTPVPVTPTTTQSRPVTIGEIHMLTLTHGWALDNSAVSRLLRTSDGGDTWQDMTPPLSTNDLTAPTAFFIDEQTGWVVYGLPLGMPAAESAVVVWHTADGGQSWSASQPLNVAEAELFSPLFIQFATPQMGWLMAEVGAGMNHQYIMLFQTTDGGTNWVRVLDPFQPGPHSCPKTGMSFVEEGTGWITANCAGLMDGVFLNWTEDGGVSWTERPLSPPAEDANFFALPNGCYADQPQLVSAQNGRLTIHCQNFDTNAESHFLYQTTDGGQTWQIYPYPGGQLIFINDQIALALGKTIHKTVNGGQNWEQISTVSWEGQFTFADEMHGWAVAREGEEIALVKTEDGGQSWQLVQPVSGE